MSLRWLSIVVVEMALCLLFIGMACVASFSSMSTDNRPSWPNKMASVKKSFVLLTDSSSFRYNVSVWCLVFSLFKIWFCLHHSFWIINGGKASTTYLKENFGELWWPVSVLMKLIFQEISSSIEAIFTEFCERLTCENRDLSPLHSKDIFLQSKCTETEISNHRK